MNLLYIYLASVPFSFVAIIWSVWHAGNDISAGELIAMCLFSFIPVLAPVIAVLMVVDELKFPTIQLMDRTLIKGRKR